MDLIISHLTFSKQYPRVVHCLYLPYTPSALALGSSCDRDTLVSPKSLHPALISSGNRDPRCKSLLWRSRSRPRLPPLQPLSRDAEGSLICFARLQGGGARGCTSLFLEVSLWRSVSYRSPLRSQLLQDSLATAPSGQGPSAQLILLSVTLDSAIPYSHVCPSQWMERVGDRAKVGKGTQTRSHRSSTSTLLESKQRKSTLCNSPRAAMIRSRADMGGMALICEAQSTLGNARDGRHFPYNQTASL